MRRLDRRFQLITSDRARAACLRQKRIGFLDHRDVPAAWILLVQGNELAIDPARPTAGIEMEDEGQEAKRLGYRANTAARALASGRTRIILLVLPDWPLDYSMRSHLAEASLVLDQAGYSLVTMTPHPGGQAQPLWETLRPDVP